MTLPPLAPETQPYFSSCLAKIRETHPDFPLDPVIFQSILLCLIAGGAGDCAGDAPHACKNLILRTGAEDVSLVLNLATMVSFLLPVRYNHSAVYAGCDATMCCRRVQCISAVTLWRPGFLHIAGLMELWQQPFTSL